MSVKKRILVVEDESSFRLIVQAALRQGGYEVVSCVNGDQAQVKLAAEKFDLMVIDYLMPGPNAIDVIQWARARSITVPAVVLTGFPSEELMLKAKAIGVARVLIKATFDITTLPRLIKDLVS